MREEDVLKGQHEGGRTIFYLIFISGVDEEIYTHDDKLQRTKSTHTHKSESE